MKRPLAKPTTAGSPETPAPRAPKAFAPDAAHDLSETIEPLTDAPGVEEVPVVMPRRRWLGRLAWGTGSLLVGLGLMLAAERLIADLFARYEWLGWVGLAALALLVLALVVIAGREVLALARLRGLDRLRRDAAAALASDRREHGRAVLRELEAVYRARPDLARPRRILAEGAPDLFDGAEIVRLAERTLMAPLDARARALTAASARRVALVTAVSPRALIDFAFVAYESIRLAGDIARLYGARPGGFGFLRVAGAVLAHLAVTGGLVLTDGVVEQLVGQGLAAKLSARLGEGLVNGLMTVRVGIAAMRVVRPLPFAALPQPRVKDFLADLGNVAATGER